MYLFPLTDELCVDSVNIGLCNGDHDGKILHYIFFPEQK